jgi:hypothetical protein
VNTAQREKAVELFGEGALIVEVAPLIRMSAEDFRREWVAGRREAENGQDSDEAHWYRDCQASRASVRARIRSEAMDEAGGRRSTDLLAVLARLEDESEPQGMSEDHDARASSPLLSLVDKIENEADPVERERLKALVHDADMANHALFAEMTRTA